jgi:hypothetical protein
MFHFFISNQPHAMMSAVISAVKPFLERFNDLISEHNLTVNKHSQTIIGLSGLPIR